MTHNKIGLLPQSLKATKLRCKTTLQMKIALAFQANDGNKDKVITDQKIREERKIIRKANFIRNIKSIPGVNSPK